MKQIHGFQSSAASQANLIGSGLVFLCLLCAAALLFLLQLGVNATDMIQRVVGLFLGPVLFGGGLLLAGRAAGQYLSRGGWMAKTTIEVDENGITVHTGSTLELHGWNDVRLVWLKGKLSAVQVGATMVWVSEVEDAEGFARAVSSMKDRG